MKRVLEIGCTTLWMFLTLLNFILENGYDGLWPAYVCGGILLLFNLQYPYDILCWISFHMFICHPGNLFGEVSVQIFAHFLIGLFVFLLFNFKSSLYTLVSNPLFDISFTNTFSNLWLLFSFSWQYLLENRSF